VRVLIDACVLFPTVMREVVLGCAKAGLFEAKWSPRILEEWARGTIKLGPEAEVFARGEIATLAIDFPNAHVPNYDGLMQRLWLPDPDDIHVLAAAVSGSCDVILTSNTKDFPRDILEEEGLARWDPDGFLCMLHDADSAAVQAVGDVVLAQANALSPDPWEMRKLMKKARLPRLGKRLA